MAKIDLVNFQAGRAAGWPSPRGQNAPAKQGKKKAKATKIKGQKKEA